MKKTIFLLSLCLYVLGMFAGTVEKTYTFNNFSTKHTGIYTSITFDHALLSGNPGEPMLPYQAISLLLPPGEMAETITVTGEAETIIPGSFLLYPQQHYSPISEQAPAHFIINEKVYSMNANYPSNPAGQLLTQYLNGYSFVLSTFTPVRYNPATGKVSYFQKVIIRITTQPGEKSSSALKNLSSSATVNNRVRGFAQNPELLDLYPQVNLKRSNYQLMIITPSDFEGGFTDMINYYGSVGMDARVVTTESIYSQSTGIDNPEKIRNAIIQEYQNNGVEYVLLGGGIEWVPCRGFFCSALSSQVYTDSIIPADLYYSGLDGNYDANGNHVYAEVADNPDLLPDIAVGRFPFSNASELAAMVHKTVSYQANPVLGEMKRPLLVGEFLTDSPPTWGGDYMDLLVDDHSDNGYFTHGIPLSSNSIEKLYDLTDGSWDPLTLMAKINQGKSFIYHLGHANTEYMLRLITSDITNENFSGVNGTDHNYALLYTQGCYCGAFDEAGCIAVKSIAIENFLVAGVFNSRYGWFDQGLTEGPSEHLQREFVSALYTDTLPEKHIGATHMISKIKTAPWVTAPGEFEPGAQRWCHYCCNVLGDPALSIWIEEPGVGIQKKNQGVTFSIFPNPTKDKVFVNGTLPASSDIQIKITNLFGEMVTSPFDFASQTRGDHTYSLKLPNLSSGIYFLKIETSTSDETHKLMIQE
jgi:hypothetical protein